MKKLTSILLTLGVLVSLTACAVSPAPEEGTTVASKADETQSSTELEDEVAADSATEAPTEVPTETPTDAPAEETTEAPTDDTAEIPPEAEDGGMLVRTLEDEMAAGPYVALIRDYAGPGLNLGIFPDREYVIPEVPLDKGEGPGYRYTVTIPELGISVQGEHTKNIWDEGYHNPVAVYHMVNADGDFSVDRVTGKVVRCTWDTDDPKELPTISDEERDRVAEEYKAKVLAVLDVEDSHTLQTVYVLSASSQEGGKVYQYTYVHMIAGLRSIDYMQIRVNEYGEFMGYVTFLLGGMAGVTMPEDFSVDSAMDSMMARLSEICTNPTETPIMASSDPATWVVLPTEDGKPMIVAMLKFGTLMIENEAIGSGIEFAVFP